MEQWQINAVINRRKELIEKVNSIGVKLNYGGKDLPAKISGAKLDYPIIYSGDITTEITWKMVEKIANGQKPVVFY